MTVGLSSLERANKGVKAQKTIDKKVVLENAICDVELNSLSFSTKKVDDKLVKSIKEYGLICPIIAVKSGNKLTVIDGTNRLNALKKLKQTTAKTIIVSGNEALLKKELASYKSENDKTENKNSFIVKDDIHEKKFTVARGIYTELPTYLL